MIIAMIKKVFNKQKTQVSFKFFSNMHILDKFILQILNKLSHNCEISSTIIANFL